MPAKPIDNSRINAAKHDFGPTYNRRWPRAYYQAHLALDYQIPERARPVFQEVFAACRRAKGKNRLTVVDIGCSYGINAALLKHALRLDDLYAAYAGPKAPLGGKDIERHRGFFAAQTEREDIEVIGIDPAHRAIDYARAAGLIDFGITTDLERHDLSPDAADRLRFADVFISCGCIGYATAATLRRACTPAAAARPWVASFVMQPFAYDEIADALGALGLHTTELPHHTERQRRFSSDAERRTILREIRRHGLAGDVEQATGYIRSRFFLSTPR